MIALTPLFVLVISVLLVLLVRESRPGLLLQRRRRQVIVTLKDGSAFSGLLFEADGECLVLHQAHALAYGQGQTNVIVEGEALLLRSDVAYIQLP